VSYVTVHPVTAVTRTGVIDVTHHFVTIVTEFRGCWMHDALAIRAEEVNQMATKKVTPKAPQAKGSKSGKPAATRVTKATKSVKAIKNVKNTMNLQ
jgi:hypothetical protein